MFSSKLTGLLLEIDSEVRERACLNLEDAAVEFSRERLQVHAKNISTSIPFGREEQVHSTESRQSLLLNVIRLSRQVRSSGDPRGRGQLARLAHAFASSAGLSEIPEALTETKKIQAHLWRDVRFLGRPIRNCRLIAEIGLRFPQFRTLDIHRIPRPRPTKLKPEHILSPDDTIQRLGLDNCKQEILKKLQRLEKPPACMWSKFKSKAKEGLDAHAEVQLLAWYSANPHAQLGLDYFGCSKRTCLLCEALMDLQSPPIRSRGRHGICYPDWGIAHSMFTESSSILERLEQDFVGRIRGSVAGEGYKIPNVPQSTVVSTLQSQELRKSREQETIDSYKAQIKEGRQIEKAM